MRAQIKNNYKDRKKIEQLINKYTVIKAICQFCKSTTTDLEEHIKTCSAKNKFYFKENDPKDSFNESKKKFLEEKVQKITKILEEPSIPLTFKFDFTLNPCAICQVSFFFFFL